jgi:ribonuclease inhibitor
MAECLELDLSVIQTPGELQRVLFEAFRLPGWYGFNWNAFHDSITDSEQSTLPDVIVLRGWDDFTSRLPDDARYLREILEEALASRPGCRVEWA